MVSSTGTSEVILGVDPGEETGLARVLFWDDKIVDVTTASVLKWQDIHNWLRYGSLTSDGNQATLVLEKFSASGRISASGMVTLRTEGYVEYRSREFGLNVVLAEPSQRLSSLSEAKEWGLQKHEARHAADALAHVLAYRRRRK